MPDYRAARAHERLPPKPAAGNRRAAEGTNNTTSETPTVDRELRCGGLLEMPRAS